MIEAAARVFRREGWSATTNRIAREAGVSIGSLYEYFPDKQALLVALAERHVELARTGIDAALQRGGDTTELVAALQRAIVDSHAIPSQAVELVADVERVGPALQREVDELRARIVATLEERAAAAGHPDARLRAQACFEAIGSLTARALYLQPDDAEALAAHYLAMGLSRVRPD